LYEYRCEKCGHRFEKIEKVSAAPVKPCPRCGGKAERVVAPSAIQFKGSGWYATDYAGKGSTAEPKAEKAEAKETKEPTATKETAKEQQKRD
jgi:putative FmdB family regulatory protein